MKKLVGMLVLMLLFGTGAYAQKQGMNPEKRAKNQVEHMKKELNLSDEQATKLSALMQEQSQKQKELMEQMKANREESKTKMKAILTQEQYIQLLEKRTEPGHRMRRMRGGAKS
ncbi:Spy/CpxP family protein refolding chaperone [Arundinibacter roseus]|nr:Spy/CpxP family protein refolding chaperone [Arundinibacter roseus]